MLLHKPASLQERIGDLATPECCNKFRAVLTTGECVQQTVYGDQMMSKHDHAFRLHIDAPEQVKQEVAQAQQQNGGMVAAARSPEVGEWTRPSNEGCHDGEGGREASVKESNHATVPLRQAARVGDLKKRVHTVPREERADNRQRQRGGRRGTKILLGNAEECVQGHDSFLPVVEVD